MLYAAYGSNLHPRRLRKRVPSADLVGCAKIEGWSLNFNKRGKDGSGKCSIGISRNSFVYVAVYDMDPEDTSILHKVEGLGYGYDEKEVGVPGYGDCYTYVGTDLDPELSPYDWYRDLVLAGCEFLEVPVSYTQTIATLPCIVDPDRARAEKNRLLLEELANDVEESDK